MNQDQVKSLLLALKSDVEEFTLIFSGKESKRVNGLYKPETYEIIIHNRNFANDNALIYTAIHEFAHHVHFTGSTRLVAHRAHTVEFRSIFHTLLRAAEEKQIYLNVFEAEEEFKTLTSEIRDRFLTGSGELMKEFGKLLMTAKNLCDKHGARFEDYLERILRMQQGTASSVIRMHALDVDPSVGFENMRTLASVRDEDKRHEMERAFRRGDSADMVKAAAKVRNNQPSQVEILMKEKDRVAKTINTLQEKLERLEEKLRELEETAEV